MSGFLQAPCSRGICLALGRTTLISLRTRQVASGIVLLTVTSLVACSRPLTDIVATNTEDGDYNMSGTREGDTLRASVCVANPRRADAVADRLLQQLYGHGLKTIVLDVYSERRLCAGSSTASA
jgi:hypothetical protein